MTRCDPHDDPIRPAALTRRAALGIAGALALGHGVRDDVVLSKMRRRKKRRNKKDRGQRGPAPVQVRFVRTWGSLGTGPGQFEDPAGLSVAPNGDVYVADSRNDRVQVFDANGIFLDQFAIDDRPTDVEVATNGELLVTARASDTMRIERFSPDGTFLGSIGGPGDGDGEFGNLFALAVGSNGDVYGGDVAADRIRQFTSSGAFIRAFGQSGSGEGDCDPAALAAAPNGDIYAADDDNFRVQRFSASGEFLITWGSQGTGEGQFEELSGITVAPDGTVFVADLALNRVQAFTSSGELRGAFGTTGSGEGQFNEPKGLAVSRDRQLYVADSKNHRIQQFALLAQKAKKKKRNKKGKKKKR